MDNPSNVIPQNNQSCHNSKFDVSPTKFFFKKLGWTLLNIVSLGETSLKNEIRQMKYIAAHSVVDGYTMKFNGKKYQLSNKYRIWTLKTIFTLGIYKSYQDIDFEKWKAKHTKFLDSSSRECFATFKGEKSEWMKLYFKCWALKWLTLGLLSPLAEYYKCQYFVNNTYINESQLHYDRTKSDVNKQLKKDILLSIVTLGIYGLIMVPYNSLTRDLKHIYIDEESFDCDNNDEQQIDVNRGKADEYKEDNRKSDS